MKLFPTVRTEGDDFEMKLQVLWLGKGRRLRDEAPGPGGVAFDRAARIMETTSR